MICLNKRTLTKKETCYANQAARTSRRPAWRASSRRRADASVPDRTNRAASGRVARRIVRPRFLRAVRFRARARIRRSLCQFRAAAHRAASAALRHLLDGGGIDRAATADVPGNAVLPDRDVGRRCCKLVEPFCMEFVD